MCDRGGWSSSGPDWRQSASIGVRLPVGTIWTPWDLAKSMPFSGNDLQTYVGAYVGATCA